MAENQKVAYVKLEGILYDDSVFRHAAYLAANHQGMAQRFARFGQALLSRQLAKVLDTNDRVSALRLAFQALRHMSVDRVQEISQEYVRDHGRSRMMDGGRKLLKRLQNDVDTIVVFSESIDLISRPLVEALPVEVNLLSNRLALEGQSVTGRLTDPVIGGQDLAVQVALDCEKRNASLAKTFGYGRDASDSLFLSAVGFPCAVNPDFTLRRIAANARWPVSDY